MAKRFHLAEFTKALAWWNKTFIYLAYGRYENLFTLEIAIFPSDFAIGKYDFSRVNKSSYLPYAREINAYYQCSCICGRYTCTFSQFCLFVPYNNNMITFISRYEYQ